MGDEKKVETEFSAVITTDEKVANDALADEKKKGNKARIEKQGDDFHVLVELPAKKK